MGKGGSPRRKFRRDCENRRRCQCKLTQASKDWLDRTRLRRSENGTGN